MPDFVVALEGERFFYLDSVASMARNGLAELNDMGIGDDDSWLDAFKNMAAELLVDWDEVLRVGNSWHDRLIGVMKRPARAGRMDAMGRLEKDIEKLAARVHDPAFVARSFLAFRSPRIAAGRRLGEVLVCLFVPALQSVTWIEDRAKMISDVTQTAVVLAATHAGFEADRGSELEFVIFGTPPMSLEDERAKPRKV